MRISRRTKWLLALAVVAVAFGIAMGEWVLLRGIQEKREWLWEQHEGWAIMSALAWYAELHEGRLPDNWQGLIDSRIARPAEPGILIPPLNSHFSQGGGSRVEDVRRYSVRFGLRAEDIVVRGDEVVDRNGIPIQLLNRRGPGRFDDDHYRRMSRALAEHMKDYAGRAPRGTPE